MRLILDTSALYYPRALEALNPGWPVVLPVVAFLERSRQLSRQGRMQPKEYRGLVERARWRIEPFDAQLAVHSPAHSLTDPSWKRLARDAMIASHVGTDDELWTANPKDFLRIGLKADQVLDVAAAYP